MDEPITERRRRFRSRLFARSVAGVVSGALAGGAVGLIVGAIAFGMGSRGMWGALAAGAGAGLFLGWFVGGVSALDTPRPGAEPLDPSPHESSAGTRTSESIPREGPGGARRPTWEDR